MSQRALLSALAVSIFLSASPASAGTKDDIRDLQARLGAAEQALAANSANTVRIGQLEAEIQSLTGRLEELSYQLEQANIRLNAVSAALAGGAEPGDASAGSFGGTGPTRLGGPVDLASGDPIAGAISRGTSEGAPAALGADAPDNLGALGGGDVALPLDPNAAFDYSSAFLLRGDYERARAAFQLYVEAFPTHSRTPDAQFRLGEIHLALGENAAAADVFINHIRNYPNDPRAAEAYLKLGSAFARLDKSAEACTVFKTMKTKFPSAADAVRQRADIEMARINCQ